MVYKYLKINKILNLKYKFKIYKSKYIMSNSNWEFNLSKSKKQDLPDTFGYSKNAVDVILQLINLR